MWTGVGDMVQPQPMYRVLERAEGLAERIRTQILSLIVDGALRPGDRLPSERVLASQFGVSRAVVREALRSLAAMNVVEARHGIGLFVCDLDLESLVEPLSVVVGMDRSALQKLAEARLVLEPSLTRLAAERSTEDDVTRLDDLVREAQQSILSEDAFMAADIAFHMEIRRIANNALLSRVMAGFELLGRFSRSLTNPHLEMRQRTVRDLQDIVAAVRDGHPDLAEEAMRAHMRDVQEVLSGSDHA